MRAARCGKTALVLCNHLACETSSVYQLDGVSSRRGVVVPVQVILLIYFEQALPVISMKLQYRAPSEELEVSISAVVKQ